MDIEKLIHQLNDIKKRVGGDNAEAIACATKIVEKQRPKRALEFTVPVFTSDGHHEEVNVNSCPTCFQTVEHTEFCPHCGQRLIRKETDGLVTR